MLTQIWLYIFLINSVHFYVLRNSFHDEYFRTCCDTPLCVSPSFNTRMFKIFIPNVPAGDDDFMIENRVANPGLVPEGLIFFYFCPKFWAKL